MKNRVTLSSLSDGDVFAGKTGKAIGMLVSFDDGFFECIWAEVTFINAEITILKPKKRFSGSGVYPWIRVKGEFTTDLEAIPQPRNNRPHEWRKDEFLIPFSSLKSVLESGQSVNI